MTKIIEAIKQANENHRHYFGFEYYAPTTEAGLITLYDRIERMSSNDPLFCSITWADYGKTADTSIEIAATCQSLLSVNYQVNITGYTSTPEEVHRWLSILKAKGVRNVMAMRGNPVRSTSASDVVHFPHAVDLIRFIRKHFGDYFGVAVAADAERSYDSLDAVDEIHYLKEKIDAGGDFIVTQSIFDASVYSEFCARCQDNGIRCPILPGIMPITSARQLSSFSVQRLSGVEALRTQLEAAENDVAEVRRVVTVFYVDLIEKLFAMGAGGVYFFTMNMESPVSSIVRRLNLSTYRAFPWRPSENEDRRRKETVRPIHWSSRVTSYMARTAKWAEILTSQDDTTTTEGPPGVAQLSVETVGYHARLLLRSRAKRCAQFLTVSGLSDIPKALTELSRIFLSFLDGSGTIPWADELSGETEYVNDITLKPMNARGLYTINSQPHVNGVSSANRVVGWGPPDGFIYQKGYLEFFCPLTLAQTVFTTLGKYSSLQYIAMNRHGKVIKMHWRQAEPTESPVTPTVSQGGLRFFDAGVTAVTWGVFPGREVIQPTIVSVDSFRAWVEEAFDLWAAPFPSNDIPPVVQLIQSEWLLVNIVDNVFQESPSPLERAVVELCSKIPPLVSVNAATQPSSTPALGLQPTQSEPAAGDVDEIRTSRYKKQDFNAGDMNDFLQQQRRLLFQRRNT